MSKPTAVDKFPVMRFSPVNEETGMERDPKGGYVLAQNYEQLVEHLINTQAAEIKRLRDALVYVTENAGNWKTQDNIWPVIAGALKEQDNE